MTDRQDGDGPTGIEAAKIVAEYIRVRAGDVDEDDAPNIIHILHEAGVRFASPTRDGAEGAGPWEKLLRAAKAMPRETPGPGGAMTEHQFTMEAWQVWDLDRALRDLEKATAAPPKPAPDAMRLPEFDDPRVQVVYGMLCDDDLNTPPNPEEHWEGWVARNIVAALAAPVPSPDGAGEKRLKLSDVVKILESAANDAREANIDGFKALTDIAALLKTKAILSPSPAVAAEPGALGEQQIVDEARRRYAGHGRFQRVFAEGAGWGLKRRASPPVRGDRTRINEAADEVVQRVVEYDDRTSPEDFPEALLITASELHNELTRFADAILSLPVQPAARPDRESLAQAYALHRWKEKLDNLPDDMKDDCYNFAGVFVGVQPGAGERISFPRHWVQQIRDGLFAVDKLPSGPLGDWAFLFREQLNDALSRQAPHSSSEPKS